MRAPVYPCVYREHVKAPGGYIYTSGLSLCVQGTWDYVQFWPTGGRFIPVCTGNMRNIKICSRNVDGLSLCVQGTYEHELADFFRQRFIPVCTGNIPIN